MGGLSRGNLISVCDLVGFVVVVAALCLAYWYFTAVPHRGLPYSMR